MPGRAMTAGQWAKLVTLQACGRVLEAITRLERQEPRAVHDTRVALRRYRTTVQALRRVLPPLPDPPLVDAANVAARNLGKALGPVREREVEIAWLEQAESQSPDDQGAIRRLIAERRADGSAVSAIDSRGTSAIIRAVQLALENTPTSGLSSRPGPVAVQLARRGSRRARRAYKTAGDSATLHRARVAAKRARYLMELIAVAKPGIVDAEVRVWTALQDALGTYNDATEGLRSLARDIERVAALPDRASDAAALARLLLRREIQRDEGLAATRQVWNDVPRGRRLERRLRRELG